MSRNRYWNMLIVVLLSLSSCGTSTTTLSATTEAASTAAPRATMQATSTPTPTARGAGSLAYIVRGDLWVRDLPDGEAQQLSNDGQSHSPRWSPSGAWLSLCKGDALWVLRRDGTDARSVGACDGQWLAGDRLSYYPSTDTDEDVPAHLLTPDKGHDQTLAHPAAQWSPDGSAYAYIELTLTGQTDADNLPERATSLWRSNAGGGDARKLFDPGTPAPYGIIPFGWYGDQLLYWQNQLFSASLLMDGATLWALPDSGGTPRQIAPAMLTNADLHTLASDGTTLAVTAGSGRETWTNKRIATVDLHTGALTYLTDEQTAAISPAWSPNAQQLAYVAMPTAETPADGEDSQALVAARRIWTMKRDGSNQHQLTSDPAYRDESPHFTADGTQIIFARFDQDEHASVWMMNADGSALTQVADNLGMPQTDDLPPQWFGYYGHVEWGEVFDYRAG